MTQTDELHDSDCAMHNEPAFPNGPCDCRLSQNVRTREEQVGAIANDWIAEGMGRDLAYERAMQMTLEAEARGAEEQRRKDGACGEADEALTIRAWMGQASLSEEEAALDFEWWKDRFQTSFSRPANVAALEARIVELEGQITALNTPQYYAAEGDDFCRDSIADILDECDAERNTIIQVNGYRQVSSEWALFDGERAHVFPTENEAEAARAALTREGGV